MSKYVDRQITSSTLEDDGFIERIHEHVTVKLKRCPCCGTPARTLTMNDDSDGDYLIAECPNCGLHTRRCDEYEETAEAWNLRRPYTTITRKAVLDCPFCGGKAEAYECEDAPDIYYVQCKKCGATSAGFADPKPAVKTWYRRV